MDNNDFKSDEFLEEKLKELDIQNGFGGEYAFWLSQELDGIFIPVIGVNDLTKEAATVLFNQFDEHNCLNVNHRIKISLLHNVTEIDFNILPNVFSNLK